MLDHSVVTFKKFMQNDYEIWSLPQLVVTVDAELHCVCFPLFINDSSPLSSMLNINSLRIPTQCCFQ